jgi:quercetin dioxygenase-like cupin family protein
MRMQMRHVSKSRLVRMTAFVVTTSIAVASYAALPTRSIDPHSVGIGTLAGPTPVYVQSVDAFLRAMNPALGTNGVLQHLTFEAGQSTLWHRHPGPNIVLVVGGSLALTDERCRTTKYYEGQGFATGLQNHVAVAGPEGADFYSLYFLPGRADVLRMPAAGESADPPRCAQQ